MLYTYPYKDGDRHERHNTNCIYIYIMTFMNHIHSQHWLLQSCQQQQVVSRWVQKATRGVSHCGLAIYSKIYLKAKEELLKLKYFTMQKYNLQKSCKRNQNRSRYYNSITNLKFQHKPKYHLSKILISK